MRGLSRKWRNSGIFVNDLLSLPLSCFRKMQSAIINSMKKYYIKTFGCQMNVHDSEKMAGILEQADYQKTDDPSDADVIVFNTCSIRSKAEQKFYSDLGRIKGLKKQNPDLSIVVAGCIAQQEAGKIHKRAPFVDHVIGPQHITRIGNLSSRPGKSTLTLESADIAYESTPAKRDSNVRAWVNIMYGCNNFCSYCIVPYTRGREVSRPSRDILEEIRALGERGYKEITLLGQNVNSYRADTDFVGLLREVNSIPEIERIRFITSHPRDFSPRLIQALSDLPKVCEHVHLPLQSGSDRILNLMNRGYAYQVYLDKVVALRESVPGIAITTDIIAGFPSETEDDHNDAIRSLKEIEFDGIFAFIYSPRPGTRAASMDRHVDDSVKSERLSHILNVQDEVTMKKNALLAGHVVDVLIDYEPNTREISGRTRTNKILSIRSSGPLEPGSIVPVVITEAYKHSLVGRPAK